MFLNFWTIGILKELVVIVGDPNKHFLSLWNRLKKMWYLKGHDFEKNRINQLITPSQAIDHKIPDLQTPPNSLEIRQQKKNDEFLKETDNW